MHARHIPCCLQQSPVHVLEVDQIWPPSTVSFNTKRTWSKNLTTHYWQLIRLVHWSFISIAKEVTSFFFFFFFLIILRIFKICESFLTFIRNNLENLLGNVWGTNIRYYGVIIKDKSVISIVCEDCLKQFSFAI